MVVGGKGNTASGKYVSVGGGRTNTASAYYSALFGGLSNIISDSSDYSFIGGGSNNIIELSQTSAILGGTGNCIQSLCDTFIAGSRIIADRCDTLFANNLSLKCLCCDLGGSLPSGSVYYCTTDGNRLYFVP